MDSEVIQILPKDLIPGVRGKDTEFLETSLENIPLKTSFNLESFVGLSYHVTCTIVYTPETL